MTDAHILTTDEPIGIAIGFTPTTTDMTGEWDPCRVDDWGGYQVMDQPARLNVPTGEFTIVPEIHVPPEHRGQWPTDLLVWRSQEELNAWIEDMNA